MADRTGYDVILQSGTDTHGRPADSAWAVTRLSDGVSLGVYSTQADVDRIIEHDRAVQAARASS